MEWVIDGQQDDSASADRYLKGSVSRRIRISWPVQGDGLEKGKPEYEEMYFCVPHQNPTLPKLDAKDLIESWINQCESEHEICKHIEEQDAAAFDRHVQQTSVGFIDVQEMRLAQLPRNNHAKLVKYAALSYVWGGKTQHRTIYKNVMNRTKADSLKEIKDLPPTIQDAIELVRALGYRFLWIDSLCIVQDSPEALKDTVKIMNLIFGNAHFTICAADGDDPSGGLKAWKNMCVPKEVKIRPDLDLLMSRPSESIIQASRWNERAWTFQERILSRRCLIFVGDRKMGNRIYFQCRSTNLAQDMYPIGTKSGWHSEWRKSPLRTLNELKRRPIRFYINCVHLYTGRNLTKPSDILNAFDGVSRLMETHMRAPFFFGLPSSHFDFALLWRPKTGKRRRERKIESSTGQNKEVGQHEDHLCNTDDGYWEFPSWSWSGWADMDDAKKGAAVLYSDKFLEGCLIDLHEWLLRRTWIVWYIRDRKGDLYSVWNDLERYHGRRLQDEEERWKGYDYFKVDDGRTKDKLDNYGRLIRDSVRGKRTNYFEQRLLKNPYGVQFSPAESKEDSYRPILQFWTWRRKFFVKGNEGKAWKPGSRLARLQVADRFGCTCGTVVVDDTEAKSLDGQPATFIALSEARKFTKDECPNWSYYIPKDFEDIEWDLFYVMLIKENTVRGVWERIGLGKVLKAAFEDSKGQLQDWSEIQLG
jgi:hypothetical protein